MPACPACLGIGHHDLRDMDAVVLERFTREELRQRGYDIDGPSIVGCDECESTGIVSEERARDLLAVAMAHVDQLLAAINEERLP